LHYVFYALPSYVHGRAYPLALRNVTNDVFMVSRCDDLQVNFNRCVYVFQIHFSFSLFSWLMSIPYTKNGGGQAIFEKKHAFSETFFELGVFPREF